jgi:uncharacterized protein YeaO (DUF488 family)
MIRIARVYETKEELTVGDALKVLVDGLWPRGVRKEDDRIDEWWRELAPAPMLRTWYSHQADRLGEFTVRYEEELAADELQPLLDKARKTAADRGLVLLTATNDLTLSHLQVLARVLEPGWHD